MKSIHVMFIQVKGFWSALFSKCKAERIRNSRLGKMNCFSHMLSRADQKLSTGKMMSRVFDPLQFQKMQSGVDQKLLTENLDLKMMLINMKYICRNEEMQYQYIVTCIYVFFTSLEFVYRGYICKTDCEFQMIRIYQCISTYLKKKSETKQ